MRFRVTLTSKHGQTIAICSPQDVHAVLYQWGLEWKTADQFHNSQVIITIEPFDPDQAATIADLKQRLRRVAQETEVD